MNILKETPFFKQASQLLNFTLLLLGLSFGVMSCGGGSSAPPPPPSTNASLSALTLTAGSFSPAFQAATTNYSLMVVNAVDSTTVTPTTSDPNATVTINGTAVVSGSASSSIALAGGANSIVVTVTAEDGTTNQIYTLAVMRSPASFELLDPTPSARHEFGTEVVILANGNIVVTKPSDSSVANRNGAVHLFDPHTQMLIASIYGDNLDDKLGSDGITVLANGNYVIVSSDDDVNGLIDAGSVRLVDGTTGVQIGATLAGDIAGDQLGRDGITALANNNYVIASRRDDENTIVDAGSVRLVDGSTGEQIGATLAGDIAGDQLGGSGVTALANNNYVIASRRDDENGIVNAGSVRLMDGSTGVQIGVALVGDAAGDDLGRDITALTNNNYVIASRYDDENGIVDAGSVRLVDGVTGEQIGATLAGDIADDQLGGNGITALANNNYVIASVFDDENTIVDAGSVRLVDGVTGKQIGETLAGNTEGDLLGSGISALANNNYVISSPLDDENSIVDAGSVRLMDGVTGEQIGATLAGDTVGDLLEGGISVLANNNFVIASHQDDVNTIVDAGSVRLVDGSTGLQIGATVAGDVMNDRLGADGISALANNNYVIASHFDDENTIVDAGSVRLVDGVTGEQIGATLAGDTTNDRLGRGGITVLVNNNFVTISIFDNEGGIAGAGSLRLVDGSSGAQIGATLAGETVGDLSEARVLGSTAGDFYILAAPRWDNGGLNDSGLVRLIAN